MESSKLNTYQQWYIKQGKGLDLGPEPPGIRLSLEFIPLPGCSCFVFPQKVFFYQK